MWMSVSRVRNCWDLFKWWPEQSSACKRCGVSCSEYYASNCQSFDCCLKEIGLVHLHDGGSVRLCESCFTFYFTVVFFYSSARVHTPIEFVRNRVYMNTKRAIK